MFRVRKVQVDRFKVVRKESQFALVANRAEMGLIVRIIYGTYRIV